ncbi:MAG: hypothetical protein LBE21_10030, partial [Pseudomonadales bacterium]|nr:hypothetical protein [Pseudomonadales bacterium]
DFKKLKTFEITPDNIYNFIARWHAAGSVLKLCEKCFTKKDTAYARFLVGLCEKVETLPDLIEIAAQKIKKQKATNTTPA